MNDIFISYAHIDNEALTEEDKGWISQFHKVLDTRVAQLTGEKPRIWRDLKLGGNDMFDRAIVHQFCNADHDLHHVASLPQVRVVHEGAEAVLR